MFLKSAAEFGQQFAGDSRPKVMMVVANRIEGDARVLKSAASLIAAGFNVVLFGQRPLKSALAEIKDLSGARCVLVDSTEFRGADTADKLAQATLAVAGRLKQLGATFAPECLYTHDYLGLDYGSKIIGALNRKKLCYWIHDVHEYIQGYQRIISETRLNYGIEVQKQFLTLPDRLVFVNERIQALLNQEHSLFQPQHILHNVPRQQSLSDFDVRSSCKLTSSDLLGVYVGRATPARGLDIFIPALKREPRLSIAALSSSQQTYLEQLHADAAEAGVGDRLHIFPYVDDREVCDAIRSADFGISPLTRYGNADLAVPTKVFEYAHADLPIVGSDATFQAEFLTSNGIGTVYRAGNAEDFVSAIGTLIAGKERFYHGLEKIRNAYAWDSFFREIATALSERKIASGRILHGPAPSAGQPYTLAKGLRQIGFDARSIDISVKRKFGYESDLNFPAVTLDQMFDVTMWALWRFDIFHFHYRSFIRQYRRGWIAPTLMDLFIYRSAGKRVFFHFRGSEARIIEIFQKDNAYAWGIDEDPSGLSDADKRLYIQMVSDLAHCTYVTDPELQRYVPNAKIVPRAIDREAQRSCVVSARSRTSASPHIVHAPTRRNAKGTAIIQAAIDTLKSEGTPFSFTILENIPHNKMAQALADADIVIDQVRIGWYGVLAVEAMALGKVVVANIRRDYSTETEAIQYPVVHATPDSLLQTLRSLIQYGPPLQYSGDEAAKFAAQYHDHRSVAERLVESYSAENNCKPLISTDWIALFSTASNKSAKKRTAKYSPIFSAPYRNIPIRILRRLLRRPVGTPIFDRKRKTI